MSAIVRELKNAKGDIVYPVTKADACFLRNGVDSVERVLNDMEDQNTSITFGDGKITKVLASKDVVTTEFLDGRIKTVTTDENGKVLQTKTTTFNDDGSINITIE